MDQVVDSHHEMVEVERSLLHLKKTHPLFRPSSTQKRGVRLTALRMASMTHRGFTVGGELAELAARLGRAPGDAASIEAERTVELQRERSRQERLEAELAAELDRQRADQERQRMDQERIEAKLVRSAELERQRVERERAEKARVVEQGTMLDANAAVWWCIARAQRRQESWSGAKRRGVMMEPVTWKPRGTAESKKLQCGANEGERYPRQSETKPYGSRQSKSRGAMNMKSASPMTTAPSRRRSGWSSGAKRRISWEERAKRFLPPTRRTRKTRKGPPNVD